MVKDISYYASRNGLFQICTWISFFILFSFLFYANGQTEIQFKDMPFLPMQRSSSENWLMGPSNHGRNEVFVYSIFRY